MKHSKKKYIAISESLLDDVEVEEVADESENLLIEPDKYKFYFRIYMQVPIIDFLKHAGTRAKWLKMLNDFNELLNSKCEIYEHSIICGFFNDVTNDELKITPATGRRFEKTVKNESGIHFAFTPNRFSRRELWNFLKDITKLLFSFSSDKEEFNIFTKLYIYEITDDNICLKNSFLTSHFFPTFLSLLNKEEHKEAEHESLIIDLTKLFNILIPNQELQNYIYILNQSEIDDIKHFCVNIADELGGSKIAEHCGLQNLGWLKAFYFKRKTIALPQYTIDSFAGDAFDFNSVIGNRNIFTALNPVETFGYVIPYYPDTKQTRIILKSLSRNQTPVKRFFADSYSLMEGILSSSMTEVLDKVFATLYLDFGFINMENSIFKCFVLCIIDANPDVRNDSIRELHKIFPKLDTRISNEILDSAWSLRRKMK